MSVGRIVQLIGPIVDVEFDQTADLPRIHDALLVEAPTRQGQAVTLTLEFYDDTGKLLHRHEA